MKINILTLFPNIFSGFVAESIPAIAIEKEKLSLNIIDFREYTTDKHRQVDDYPYGGGAGMVIKPEPLAAAIEDTMSKINDKKCPIIYFTPQGHLLNQKKVRELLTCKELILICGHYKEIDQRIREKYVTHEISIGDYVLSGGEIPAMALTDAIARLIDGVLSDSESANTDSHENGLLGYPCYTRPAIFKGMKVPDVLINGHHKMIEQWRTQKSIEITEKIRPEMIKKR